MRRIGTIMVSLLAVLAVSAVASASASAGCFRVAVAMSGNKDSSCNTNMGATKDEYIVGKLERQLGPWEWCTKVTAKTGIYENELCTIMGGEKEYIKVLTPHFLIPCHKVSAANKGKGEWNNNTCTEADKTNEYTYYLLPGETVAVTGASGLSKLTATILGVTIDIECKKDTFSGTLESGGKTGAGSISFKECKLVTAEKKCKLTSSEETEIPTTFNQDQLEEKGGRLIDRFEPVGATNTFATITIEKKGSETCTIEGSYKVTGSQYCEVDTSNAEAESLKPKHNLICNSSGSELYIGSTSNPASFESKAEIELTGGGEWAIISA